ncbi:MAG: substrate-binding domain-containing protein [Verrucomicrobiota bacterium JB024]|nr:substrate-binding domain-containing protein [Verrucomicrobiota bacterium JB024]
MNVKYKEIAETLLHRIQRGDYAVNSFPGQPTLAKELGVSYLTARRAITDLIDRGVLTREYNGRVKIAATVDSSRKSPLNIAFLTRPTPIAWDWYAPLQAIVEARQGSVRMLNYLDWHDQNVYDAIGGQYDGAFIIPTHDITRLALDLLVENRHRVVTLFQDLTEYGVPYVDQAPANGVFRLIEHLVQLGHRTIDCLNTEPHDLLIRQNIAHWRHALEHFGVQGTLQDVSDEPYPDGSLKAYHGTRKLFYGNKLKATAIFSTTVRTANGLYRAAYDRGIQIGKDLSVCAFGSYEIAQIMIPSLTCEKSPERTPFLERGLEWILTHGKNWTKPLRICPGEAGLFHGESTAPPPQPTEPIATRASHLK